MTRKELSLFHCGKPLELKTGADIYPKRPHLADKFFYRCSVCEAFVGCHPGTKTILGTPADATLRKLRSHAHALLDPYWKFGGLTRTEAYEKLAKRMGMEEIHISWLDIRECTQAIEILKRGLTND